MTAVPHSAVGRPAIAGGISAMPVAKASETLAAPVLMGGFVLFGVSLMIYLGLAALLVFGMNSVEGDVWSRVGNAFYMLYSRDPHLAALGFVWNPLPSLAVLPLLPLKGLWPPLVEQGFAGNIVSALCMAGAVYQVRATLRELEVSRVTSVILTVLFALHPMILLYAANGMSEAMFLFFGLTAVRHLTKWVRVRESPALVHAGMALALLYLTRYEAVAVAAGSIVFVAVLGYLRGRGYRRERGTTAVADALILGVPFASAVVLWALASWMIVGSPFETFTSVYGSTSQLQLSAQDIQAATGQGTPAAIGYVARQILGLEPVLAIAGAGLILALVRRNAQTLVPIVLLGAALSFSVWTFLTGRSFGLLRFSIAVVPLVTLVAGAMLARHSGPHSRMSSLRMSVNLMITLVTVELVALGLPSGLATMHDAKLGRDETDQVKWFIGSAEPLSGRTRYWQAHSSAAHELDAYLDGLALPPGSVLIDVAIGFPVVLQSRQPTQFVITPDRDFPAVVADPAAFGVRYLVVPPPEGYGGVNAIERVHPGVYATGAGIANLVKQFGSDDLGPWRLYQVQGVP
jgi:hypothetical protein